MNPDRPVLTSTVDYALRYATRGWEVFPFDATLQGTPEGQRWMERRNPRGHPDPRMVGTTPASQCRDPSRTQL